MKRQGSPLVSYRIVRCVLLLILAALGFLPGLVHGQVRSFASERRTAQLPPTRGSSNRFSLGLDLSRPRNLFSDEEDSNEEELPSTTSQEDDTLLREMKTRHQKVLNRARKINSSLTELERLLERLPSKESTSNNTSSEAPTTPEHVPTPKPLEDVVGDVIPKEGQPDAEPWHHVADPIRVAKPPIDRLSFANNAYGHGEVNLALRSYKAIDQSTLTVHERVWVEFQIGQCYRRLGDKANADTQFRIVAQDPNGGKWSEFAKWWLTTEDKLLTLKERSKMLSETLRSTKEQLNDTKP